jgi:hypothetical protein
MRGYEAFNFPAFDEAATLGRSLGWGVISPAELDREAGFDETRNSLDGFDIRAALRRDIEAIMRCDAIAMLPFWYLSKGATAERAIAEVLDLQILDASTFAVSRIEKRLPSGYSKPVPVPVRGDE